VDNGSNSKKFIPYRNRNMKWIEQIPVELIYGIIAVLGGCARYLNSFASGKKFHFTVFLASAFVAGFSGYMFALLGESLNLPATMTHIMAGVGGFFGEQTLKFIYEWLQNKI
jgi:hypothetical protein